MTNTISAARHGVAWPGGAGRGMAWATPTSEANTFSAAGRGTARLGWAGLGKGNTDK